MSPYPKCPVCQKPHASGATHIWEEISRDVLGREVAVPVPEPAMERILKRDDEVVARQGDKPQCISIESSQPPLISDDIIFDRKTYMRNYMRDLAKAKAEGLTVAKWRKKHQGA